MYQHFKHLKFALILLTICSCKSDKTIELIGNIDHKVNGKIHLSISENNTFGVFQNSATKQKIDLRGTLVKNQLRLEEFAEKNKLSGFFEGTYENGSYNGYWISPERTKRVPFTFKLTLKEDNTVDQSSRMSNLANIKLAFKKWVTNKNELEFCSREECEETLEKQNEGIIHCGHRIIEKFEIESAIIADINNDGINDAIFNASYEQCMSGTWFINVAAGGHLVCFISKSKDEYSIIDEPKEIVNNIGLGGILKIENGILYAKGTDISGDENIHYIDIEWEAQFKFENNKFKLLSKSQRKKIVD